MSIKKVLVFGALTFVIIVTMSLGSLAAVTYLQTGVSDKPGTTTQTGTATTLSGEGPCSRIPNDAQRGFMRDYIVQAADYFKIPAAFLAAVMQQESNFNPIAGSGAGARGLMQLMPDTYKALDKQSIQGLSQEIAKARGYSQKNQALRTLYKKDFENQGSPPHEKLTGDPNTDIVNQKYNVFLGAAYYRQHFDDFSNQSKYHRAFAGNELYRVMLAAYNAGPGAVDKYGGVPPYRETMDYVVKITGYYTEFSSCEKNLTPKISAGSSASNANTSRVRTNSQAGFGGQGCDPTGCERADEKLLNKTFGSGGWSWGQDPSATPQSLTAPPSQSDLDKLKTVLQSTNNVPVWHINGQNSGQHWIIVTGIDAQNNIEFHDPAANKGAGGIRTLPYNQQVTLDNGTAAAYFGITPQGGQTSGNKRQFIAVIK